MEPDELARLVDSLHGLPEEEQDALIAPLSDADREQLLAFLGVRREHHLEQAEANLQEAALVEKVLDTDLLAALDQGNALLEAAAEATETHGLYGWLLQIAASDPDALVDAVFAATVLIGDPGRLAPKLRELHNNWHWSPRDTDPEN